MLIFKKYFIYLISAAFFLIGLINSFRFKFPAGTDGFFHYYFSKVILENNFLLLKSIPFWWDGVIVGYPPLFHYTAALTSRLFSLDLLTVYHILPWVFFLLLL